MATLATQVFERNPGEDDFAFYDLEQGYVCLCVYELRRLWEIPYGASRITIHVSTRRNKDAFAIVPNLPVHKDDSPCYVVLARFPGETQASRIEVDFTVAAVLYRIFQKAKNPKALWVSVTTP